MLRVSYDNQEDIPEQYRDLFTEKDGKWILTGVEGLKSQADVDRQLSANQKERKAHKETKDKLALFSGINVETIHTDMDELKELRVLKESGTLDGADPDKINQLVEAQLVRKLGPVQRELAEAITARDEAQGTATGLQDQINKNTISAALRKAAAAGNLIPTAVDDALMLGLSQMQLQEDGQIMTEDGLTPDLWLTALKETRPHWWALSQGAGAQGGRGPNGSSDNPWSAKNWNITNQGKYFQEHGADKAAQMAKMAGSHVGATTPAEKS